MGATLPAMVNPGTRHMKTCTVCVISPVNQLQPDCSNWLTFVPKIQLMPFFFHRWCLTGGALLLLAVQGLAQDKHFSQFYAAPLTLNPAMTGAIDGRFRVGAIYRDQWRNALETPYTTAAAMVDVKFNMSIDSRYEDAVGAGLLFFNDRVSSVDFSTNQMALALAFHKGLDYGKKQILSLGLMAGLTQRNINYENLTFQDAFNGINSYTDRPSREVLPPNNFSYGDFHTGLLYRLAYGKWSNLTAGIGYFHFNRPEVSFYADQGLKSKLYSKWMAHVQTTMGLSEYFSVSPRINASVQGPHMEVNAGANVRFRMNDYNQNAFTVGAWARPVRTESSFGVDALVALVGFEINGIALGLSYDITLRDVSTFPRGRNALEFSLTYIGSFEDEDLLCPRF